MKKMYLATATYNTIFIFDDDASLLTATARRFLNQEKSTNSLAETVDIKEILVQDDIPEDWKLSVVWGTNSKLSSSDLLDKIILDNQLINDTEYPEYLRLKQKFEGSE